MDKGYKMNKKKWFIVSFISVLAIVLFAVFTLIYKNINNKTSQISVLTPSSTSNSPLPRETQETSEVDDVLTPTPVTPTANAESNQPIDLDKFSKLITSSYDSSIKEVMDEDLNDTINDYAILGYKITSFSVADVNNDNQNELVITYSSPIDGNVEENEYSLDNNSDQKGDNHLSVYGFNSGLLKMYDCITIPVTSTVTITNLVPDEKKEIFIMEEDMSEYPYYSMYVIKNNKLDIVDFESIGLNPQKQFVSVGYDTIYMGSRITGGVYGGDTLKWVNGEFVSIEDHYTDNRLLYKTQQRDTYSGDISTLHKYDTNIPELKNGEVTVDNPYQLISLIGPNRTIYLNPGIYDLGYADSVQNQYVRTRRESSGDLEFCILNVENLKIIGLGDESVEIALTKEDSSVLKVSESSNVSFSNIIMGHGFETYGCVAEVLSIEDSSEINIENCSFYGCGAYGIVTKNVVQMNVSNSVIEECSFGGVIIDESTDIKFDSIKFQKNSGTILIKVNNSQNVVFDGVTDHQNDYDIFENHDNSTIEINNIERTAQ